MRVILSVCLGMFGEFFCFCRELYQNIFDSMFFFENFSIKFFVLIFFVFLSNGSRDIEERRRVTDPKWNYRNGCHDQLPLWFSSKPFLLLFLSFQFYSLLTFEETGGVLESVHVSLTQSRRKKKKSQSVGRSGSIGSDLDAMIKNIKKQVKAKKLQREQWQLL